MSRAPSSKLPEGFVYSREAQRGLKQRSKEAGERLRERTDKDERLKERVQAVLDRVNATLTARRV